MQLDCVRHPIVNYIQPYCKEVINIITQEEFDNELKKICEENESKERKLKLKQEKAKFKTKHKTPSTSKLVLLGVILLCLEIVIFCEYAMVHLNDTSALYALIGIPVAIAPTVVSYYMKSKAENTEGGIIYETAMAEIEKLKGENPDSLLNTDEEEIQG